MLLSSHWLTLLSSGHRLPTFVIVIVIVMAIVIVIVLFIVIVFGIVIVTARFTLLSPGRRLPTGLFQSAFSNVIIMVIVKVNCQGLKDMQIKMEPVSDHRSRLRSELSPPCVRILPRGPPFG